MRSRPQACPKARPGQLCRKRQCRRLIFSRRWKSGKKIRRPSPLSRLKKEFQEMADNPIQPSQADRSAQQPDLPDDTGIRPKAIVKDSVADVPRPTPITTKGQKYVAPLGRHSQQTHRRAE